MRIKPILRIMTSLVLGVTILLMSGRAVQAETNTSHFLIYPELPKDNIGGYQTGFYNLKNQPNQTKHLRIKLINAENRPVTIQLKAVDATTTDAGTVDYTGHQPVSRRLLTKPGSQAIQVASRVVLAPNQTKWVPIDVRMPKQFVGRKTAAIVLQSTDTKRTEAGIRNRYVYAVGFTLNGRAIQKKDYQYAKVSRVSTQIVNQQPMITTSIDNPDAMYLKKTTVSVVLKNKKWWHWIDYRYRQSKVTIAPNSRLNSQLSLAGRRLVPGVYRMTVHVKTERYQKTIIKQVRITKNQANLMNRKNIAWQRKKRWLIIAGIIVAILIGSYGGYRWIKRGTNDKKQG